MCALIFVPRLRRARSPPVSEPSRFFFRFFFFCSPLRPIVSTLAHLLTSKTDAEHRLSGAAASRTVINNCRAVLSRRRRFRFCFFYQVRPETASHPTRSGSKEFFFFRPPTNNYNNYVLTRADRLITIIGARRGGDGLVVKKCVKFEFRSSGCSGGASGATSSDEKLKLYGRRKKITETRTNLDRILGRNQKPEKGREKSSRFSFGGMWVGGKRIFSIFEIYCEIVLFSRTKRRLARARRGFVSYSFCIVKFNCETNFRLR